jgi:hypothetical protein
MRFDVSIAHEANFTRVEVIGEPALGRLLSLLQVLEVDSASWPSDAAMLDLRGLRAPLAREEQSRFAGEAARSLQRVKRIAVLAADVQVADAGALRFFADAHVAQGWLESES